MPTEHAAARCEDLVKTYTRPTGVVYALKGVDASFGWNGLSAIVGPSGSGKSSLLRILAGMDRPTSGRVFVDGVSVERSSARSLRRLRRGRVGYVFQRPSDNFVPHLTVAAHLDLARRASRTASDPHELLERLGLGHRADHLAHELSGGEQQRAAFAQSVAAGCSVIVADEPTAELDTSSAGALLEIARDLADGGLALILATHDGLVVDAADDVIRLDHGRVHTGASAPPAAPPARATRGRRTPGAALRSGYKPPPVVRVKDVTKSYTRGSEEVHALRSVTCEFVPGELIGLVGRSGSGKSTLLNVLAGWEHPDGGHVEWIDMPDSTLHEWRDVAVVPQKLGLIEELTVGENIAYPLRLAAIDAGGWTDGLLGALHIEHLKDRFPSETSVGEQQRIALARALAVQPTLLLADEPTGHQDDLSAAAVFDALRSAAGGGTCCVIATHNLGLVDELDRVFEMSDGILTPASPQDLLAAAEEKQQLGGEREGIRGTGAGTENLTKD